MRPFFSNGSGLPESLRDSHGTSKRSYIFRAQGLGDFLPQALESRAATRGTRTLLQSRHNTQATVAELTPALVADLVGDSVNATFGSLFDMSTLQSRSQNKVAGCTPSIRFPTPISIFSFEAPLLISFLETPISISFFEQKS